MTILDLWCKCTRVQHNLLQRSVAKVQRQIGGRIRQLESQGFSAVRLPSAAFQRQRNAVMQT